MLRRMGEHLGHREVTHRRTPIGVGVGDRYRELGGPNRGAPHHHLVLVPLGKTGGNHWVEIGVVVGGLIVGRLVIRRLDNVAKLGWWGGGRCPRVSKY